MKRFFKITAVVGLLAFIASCQLFADKKKDDFEFLPWPDMVGVPPDSSVKNWVKFDLIGTMNHPFPFVWFSPQQFEREYPNVLIKLEEDGYEQFKIFVRANECEKNLNNVHGDPLLRVTEYANDQQIVRCIMPPANACEYVKKMYALPLITWTPEQTEELRLMGNDLSCGFVNNKYQIRKY